MSDIAKGIFGVVVIGILGVGLLNRTEWRDPVRRAGQDFVRQNADVKARLGRVREFRLLKRTDVQAYPPYRIYRFGVLGTDANARMELRATMPKNAPPTFSIEEMEVYAQFGRR